MTRCVYLEVHELSLERYTKNGLPVLSEMGLESCRRGIESRFVFLYVLLSDILFKDFIYLLF